VRRAARGITAAAALATLAATVGASPVAAATVEANCANVQEKINELAVSSNHGEGSVIVLDGMCDAKALGSSSGVTLPKESSFSIEGKPGTTSGFDGEGVTGSLLATTGFEVVGAMAFRNLTFQHARAAGADGGGGLSVRASQITLSGDSFLEDTVHGVSAAALFIYVGQNETACPPASGPPAITITNTTFRGNVLTVPSGIGAGGAAWLENRCKLSRAVLEGNTFAENTLEANGSLQVLGGGLFFVGPSHEVPSPLFQSGNVFDSNRIVAIAGSGDYGGGGEWTEGASLTSLADRFSRNSIPGTTGANWSWGGGLGILNTTCNAVTSTESTLEDAVVAGNSIGSGTSGDLGGAGIYIGCGPSLTNPNHLRLLDSTVTENSVPSGGIPGIDGNPGDHLEIANSIVAADSGGNETGGFNGPGGSLTATYSDVCAGASSAPLSGAGNICANPLLADNGSPTSFDIHETASSPTIDAGSNGLVPAGLATDFYGAPRIQPAHAVLPPLAVACPICGCSYGYTLTGGVDMGASELGPVAVPAIAFSRPCGLPPSQFSFPSVTTLNAGRLQLRFSSLAAGKLSVLGTFKLTRTLTKRVHGHRRRVKHTETITYCRASLATSAPGNIKLALTPTGRALSILRSHHRLKVTLTITFTQPGHTPATRTETITVLYKAPKPKRRHQ